MRYATAVAVLFLVASVGNARAASSARATTGTPAGRGVVAGASGPGPSHVARGRAAARRTARPAATRAASKPRPAARPDPARFAAESPAVETGADFLWRVDLLITNPDSLGLYLDSLTCEVTDLDPGETRAERVSRMDLTRLVQLVNSVPAGDSTIVQHSGPAVSEHAKLVYRLHGHRADGRSAVLETTVEATPGASTEYESKFLDVDGGKVEYVIVPALGGAVAPPGVLMIHGHGNHARHMIRMARQLAARGFTVALPSMPGYGQSTGAPDLMGPRSVDAAARVLDVLEHTPGVDGARIAAWGISRGATVAAELAARRPDLKAVIVQSGILDLWAVYRGTSLDGFRETIVAEAGADSAAWRARSPLLDADRISAPVLVLHGEKDRNVPAAQAHAFVAALEKRGAPVESHFSAADHQLPLSEVQRAVVEFLSRRLKK